MADILDEKTLRTAAEWWTRLRAPDSDAQTMEQWLAWTEADARHLEAFERVTELGNRLGTLDDVTRRQWTKEFARRSLPSRRWVPLAAAASVLLALSGGYVAWNHLGADGASQDYASAVAQNRDITLPDGSSVTLGGASTLTTRFSAGERHVELGDGEAFFQVAHNPQRPFVVSVGDVSIHDIGTAFDVRRTGRRVAIAVTQGRVHITDNRSATGGGLDAVAGQLVSYDPATSAMSVGSITSEQATAWRDDRLEFINEPLGVVVANVNRYSARPVHIADASLEGLAFTGTVKADAIDSWLGALPQIFPLQVSKNADQVTLSRAEREQGRPSPAKK